MSTPTQTKLLKLARLIAKERAINQQARDLRDEIMKLNNGTTGGYYTSTTFHRCASGELNAITLQVDPAQWMAAELPAGQERPKPELQMFRDPQFYPKPYGRLFYPAIWIGEFVPGKQLWITSASEKFDLPDEQPIAVVVPEVAEAFGMAGLPNVAVNA